MYLYFLFFYIIKVFFLILFCIFIFVDLSFTLYMGIEDTALYVMLYISIGYSLFISYYS